MQPLDLQRFGDALDAIRKRVEADIGAKDMDHIRRVDKFSHAMEVTGRVLLHMSIEPVAFSTGVMCLWIHKQIQATEIGHAVLHGAFDRIDGAEPRYRKSTFRWQTPIDEESWSYLHNVVHHSYTNIAGKDADLFDIIAPRPRVTRGQAIWKVLRKFAPYYAREYIFFPALAGPLFWKVLLGNMLSDAMRDVYSIVTIYCGHDGEDIAYYPEGTKAGSRAEWYRMQVDATNNFEVPLPISILCGGLDLHIEHHLFPHLPPNRLREIAPQVRRVCEEHGLRYRSDTWPNTIRKVWNKLRQSNAGATNAKGTAGTAVMNAG